ncbi:hypothetical protein ABT072_30625 [Streptomyces sp. NPDC002589]|uniref:hypothetical protein n=1 Tax=Streptomyces sp. NPDC002589 TaxID=3154420 RepID=UPI003327883B
MRASTGRAPDTNVVVVAHAATSVQRHSVSRPGDPYYRLAFTADGSTLICGGPLADPGDATLWFTRDEQGIARSSAATWTARSPA